MRKRKKITPRWLSIIRKLHTYLGGTTLITGTLQYIGWGNASIILFMGWWMALGMLIQVICDVSYQKERPESFKPEKYTK